MKSMLETLLVTDKTATYNTFFNYCINLINITIL